MTGKERFSSSVVLTLVCFALGIVLVVQFRTQGKIATDVSAQSSTDQALIISSLVEGNASLRKEANRLAGELAGQGSIPKAGSMEAMVEELNKLRMVNGLLEVMGPGIEVRIDGSITALDLQDLVNEVWNAGAEAVAINHQRVVGRSAVVWEENAIYLDGTRLGSPYIINAIGHPEALEKALSRPGGLIALLQYTYSGASIAVTGLERISMPVYRGRYEFRYAQVMK